jgi:hypothetical protein
LLTFVVVLGNNDLYILFFPVTPMDDDGQHTALSPLFVKLWRMRTIVSGRIGFRRILISHYEAFLYTVPLVMIEIILLSFVTLLDPPLPHEELGVGNDDGSTGVQQITCEHQSNAFFITQVSFGGKKINYLFLLLFMFVVHQCKGKCAIS